MGRTFDALRAAEEKRDESRVAAGGPMPGGEFGEPVRAFGSLVHRVGRRRGTVHGFASSDVIMIGRGRHNDVEFDVFEDSTVSTTHAEIRFETGRFVLYDLGSLNGTFLNGHPIRRSELKPGDEIALGRQGPVLRFGVEEHPASPPPEAGKRTSFEATEYAPSPPTDRIVVADESPRLRRIERALYVLIGVAALDVILRATSFLR